MPGKAGIFVRNPRHLLRKKGGENNQTPKGGRTMMKRLALLCCILLLPTIAAAAYQPGQTNYGEWWAGVHAGGLFASDYDTAAQELAALSATTSAWPTDQSGKGISAWLWTSPGTSSTTQKPWRVETSSLYLSWPGSSTHSWEMTRLPLAGSCHS